MLAALALACAAPLIGAHLVHESWPPERRMNTGELIDPLPLPETVLWRLDGTPFHFSELKGRWIMVQLDEARCAEACRKKLYQMRQVRLAQGRDMHRIERLWLVADDAPVAAPLIGEFAGTHVLRARDSRLLARFPAQRDLREHIYLIDPLGNLMLRYPRDADPSGMKRDLARLLKLSRLG
ncbi:MAG: cytochrome C oxidase subunit I [Betaproteobacteria bacterium]|nr:cytochrome C oxidase subunit I [Betaproteobacteria bacterium]